MLKEAGDVLHERPRISDEARSLEELRRWMVERCDVVVAVGGRWWLENPIGAGIPIEFELAQSRGLPCFLLGVFGGAAAGYLPDI